MTTGNHKVDWRLNTASQGPDRTSLFSLITLPGTWCTTGRRWCECHRLDSSETPQRWRKCSFEQLHDSTSTSTKLLVTAVVQTSRGKRRDARWLDFLFHRRWKYINYEACDSRERARESFLLRSNLSLRPDVSPAWCPPHEVYTRTPLRIISSIFLQLVIGEGYTYIYTFRLHDTVIFD